MKPESYLLAAQNIIANYSYPQPFHLFLKAHFKANKQFGSRDRKIISALLYGYLRLPKQEHLSTEDAMQLGIYLCAELPANLAAIIIPNYIESYNNSLEDKLHFVQEQRGVNLQFTTWHHLISDEVPKQTLQSAFYNNAKIFIRCGKHVEQIKDILKQKNIDFTSQQDAIGIEAPINLEQIIPKAHLYAVQDISSQQICRQFTPTAQEHWWDCCAASGGKSLALLSQNVPIQLTLSDIRPGILLNLAKRFKQYGYRHYTQKVIDMCAPIAHIEAILQNQKMDNIICDVPCSGSGTWHRTPEQAFYWQEKQLLAYTNRQYTILQNALKCLKPNGVLHYITCSIFTAENEDVINRILREHKNLQCLQQGYTNNAAIGGDIMYSAQLKYTMQ